MHWYVEALRKYAVFRGRARRKEYWVFFLVNTLVFVGIGFLSAFVSASGDVRTGEAVLWVLLIPFTLFILIPHLAVCVRRLHDLNLSGFWIILFIATPVVVDQVGFYLFPGSDAVPVLSLSISAAWLVVAALPGTKGENRFGPDPLGEQSGGVFGGAGPLDGKRSGQIGSQRFTVGRSEEADLKLDVFDDTVSGIHAELRVDEDGSVKLIDRNSTNGLFVFDGNNWRNVLRCELSRDTRVRLGGVEVSGRQLLEGR
ncbi:DUF805 domain-containing protein [Halorhodospira sp. 9622]|uniref:DUF805 domain-containing protein n=1 Tax=Halorhodospira sp. 9622 TaxID=2899136 RepID=UPI001EE82E2D|nr:DUF805 domain-containing protein [Halorhodospira sp. 9622]MCG5539346.1 DUF805 domain-containing protein [Halorhodospira sp. 9622]